MAGYFGDEPTCARCDYPRRLHHMLRAEHEYDASNENAPDAGQGIEGKEHTPNQEGDSVTHITEDPRLYIVDTAEVVGIDSFGSAIGVHCSLEQVVDVSDYSHFAVSFTSPKGCGLNPPEVNVDQLPDLAIELIRLYFAAKQADQ